MNSLFNKLRTVAFVVFLVTVSLTTALWINSLNFQIQGLTVNLHAFPALHGATTLEIPPLGEITSKTHTLPLAFKVTVKQLSMSYLTKVAAPTFSLDNFLLAIQQEGKKAIINYIIKLALLAILVNFLLAWLITRRLYWLPLISALLVVSLIIGFALLIKNQYDLSAFRQPRYSGLLTAAPWLVGTVEEKINDFEAFRAEVKQLAANLYNFYSKTGGWSQLDNLEDNTIKLLHVSDIHNNPAAFDLIKQVVKDFKVNFIVDTGDITDLGTPVEAQLISQVESLNMPYFYIAGNHDSTEVINKLSSLKNLTVVSKPQFLSKNKLKILAFPDPAAANGSPEPVAGAQLEYWQKTFYANYQQTATKPDIVASHSVNLIKNLIGQAPVILVGHDHQPTIKMVKKSIIVNAGTTGAAGIRGLNLKNPPMSLKILYFNKKNQRLLAIDSLTLQPLTNEFFLQRSLIKNGAKKSLPIKQSSSSFSMTWLKRVN